MDHGAPCWLTYVDHHFEQTYLSAWVRGQKTIFDDMDICEAERIEPLGAMAAGSHRSAMKNWRTPLRE
ncbi:hypothetical protein PWP93_20485 [Paraburkholderia sp. A1RI-2L]|uniref:hypothetical protein n=1 Tax=Paraburkholderia sp. A1RI-2L TaxID=3028367 RepID=UPI003B7C96B0